MGGEGPGGVGYPGGVEGLSRGGFGSFCELAGLGLELNENFILGGVNFG